MRLVAALAFVAACAPAPLGPRQQRVVEALADENYIWALRDPGLVAMKVAKMQRSPFEWLRGTAGVFWRDTMEPGGSRPATAFGDPASSRVLLVGDPHPENIGTFRAPDGMIVVDWNDFDSSGYGPYEGDLRRLATGVVVAAANDTIRSDLVRAVADGYSAQIAALAAGVAPSPMTAGIDKVLDKLIKKARDKGDAGTALSEIAPVAGDGQRAIAFGDLDPVGDDRVIENRQVPVGPDAAAEIAHALARWRSVHPEAGAIKLQARKIGSGVASYPALRYYVVLEGPTADNADDLVIELKETRDGLVIRGVPRLASAEWSSPGERAVDAQRRLHVRPDEDQLLGSGEIGGLSMRIRDRAAYQSGVNATDLATLAAGNASDRERLRTLASHFGALLARAHGEALTTDAVLGWTVIAPLIAGREVAFADELEAFARADVEQLEVDYAALHAIDLSTYVLPVSR